MSRYIIPWSPSSSDDLANTDYAAHESTILTRDWDCGNRDHHNYHKVELVSYAKCLSKHINRY